MPYESTNNAVFQSTVASWIAEKHEVLAMIRFHAAAGSKSFEFFDSFEAFRTELGQLPPRACVTVFRERQLPVRGRVDADFINQALASIPDGTEYLLVGLELITVGKAWWFYDSAGETHAELSEELEGQFGQLVAVGPYPPWLEDNEDIVSAVVPDSDGSIHTGVY